MDDAEAQIGPASDNLAATVTTPEPAVRTSFGPPWVRDYADRTLIAYRTGADGDSLE